MNLQSTETPVLAVLFAWICVDPRLRKEEEELNRGSTRKNAEETNLERYEVREGRRQRYASFVTDSKQLELQKAREMDHEGHEEHE